MDILAIIYFNIKISNYNLQYKIKIPLLPNNYIQYEDIYQFKALLYC